MSDKKNPDDKKEVQVIVPLSEWQQHLEAARQREYVKSWMLTQHEAAQNYVQGFLSTEPSAEEVKAKALELATMSMQEFVDMRENFSLHALQSLGREVFFGRIPSITKENEQHEEAPPTSNPRLPSAHRNRLPTIRRRRSLP